MNPVDMATSAAEQGSKTLWEAIGQLPPGIQISLILTLAMLCTSIVFNFMQWRQALKERELSDKRQASVTDVLQQTNIALALVKDRMG